MLIQNLLQLLIEPFSFRQQIIQFHLAEHTSEGRLRELRRRVVITLDLDDRPPRIDDAEIDNGVHLYRDVIAGDDVLRRHIHDDRAQAHPHHSVDWRKNENDAGALRAAAAACPSRKITPRSYSARILIDISTYSDDDQQRG